MTTAPTAPDHDIAVVIVNYNSADMSLAAIESVITETLDMTGVHIHLVDNASPNGDAAVLRVALAAQDWPVTLYEEAVNHGFGRGNNVALRAIAAMPTPPSKVMCLNPDAVLSGSVIDHLSSCLDSWPGAVVAGATLRNEDGSKAASAFRFPNLCAVFSDAVNFGPISDLFARWRVPIEPMPKSTITHVDWVTGAAFMARLDAVRKAGFFDPNYFLYFEEVDLMKAIRADGGIIVNVANATVYHIGGAITQQGGGGRQARPAYWYDSWTWYFLSNHGRIYTALASLLWLIGAMMDGIISTLRRRTPIYPKHFFRDFFAVSVRRQLGGGPGDPRSAPDGGS